MRKPPSFLPPASRRAAPRCEPLEGRTLLAGGFVGPTAPPPDPSATVAQVNHALREAWERLAAQPDAPPPRSVMMDLDGDRGTYRLDLSRPDGASSEILDFLVQEMHEGKEDGLVTHERLTLGYVARSLMLRDLDGDGNPDLFLTGESGGTLILGSLGLPSLPVVARDVTGDGITDLVVTCPLTHSTWVLRGLGDGRFGEKPWLVLDAGDRPVASFVEDFDGDGLPDLVTVDGGSNAVTFYSDLTGPVKPPQTLFSGGHNPVAALARDVNGDKVPDLIVANHDDGRITLFLGGTNGLTPAETLTTPSAQPVALASGAGKAPGQVYVAFDNSEPAQWLSFTLPETQGTPLEQLGEEGSAPPAVSAAPGRTEGKLRALSATKLNLVPTLVRLLEVEETGSDPAEPGAEQAGAPAAAGIPVRAVAPPVPGASLGDADWAEGLEGETTVGLAEGHAGLQRFLLGVDEAAAPTIPTDEGPRQPMAFGGPPAAEETSEPALPTHESPRDEAGGEDQPVASRALSDRDEERKPECDVQTGLRRVVVMALASQVGLAWAAWEYRRRKGAG